jgi:hypothetical protein
MGRAQIIRPLQFAVDFSCQILTALIIGIYYPRSVVPIFVYTVFEVIIFPLLQHNVTHPLFLSNQSKLSEKQFKLRLVAIVVIKSLLIVPGCLYTYERLADHIQFNHEWKETIDLDADYEIWSPLFDNLKCTIMMCILASLGALRKGLLIAFNSLIETNIDTKNIPKPAAVSGYEFIGYIVGTLGTFLLYNKVAYEWFTERTSFYYTPLAVLAFVATVGLVEILVALGVKKVNVEKKELKREKPVNFEEAVVSDARKPSNAF